MMGSGVRIPLAAPPAKSITWLGDQPSDRENALARSAGGAQGAGLLYSFPLGALALEDLVQIHIARHHLTAGDVAVGQGQPVVCDRDRCRSTDVPVSVRLLGEGAAVD